ncbi:MAG: YcdB/YcdC domain-containing protein [Clostridium sp.]
MKKKNKKIFSLILIVILLIVISLSAHVIIGNGKKEIKAARNFKELLYSEDMINKYENDSLLSYKSTRKIDASNSKRYYTVTTKYFTMDIDDSYNVVGFNNMLYEDGKTQIDKESAKEISENYLKKLYNGDYEYDSLVEDDTLNVPYYTFIFKKCEKGYPYYDKKITLQINKFTGNLDGYVNFNSYVDTKDIDILLSEEEAISNALKDFNEINKNGEILGIYKAWTENEDKSFMELCYVITLKGIDEEEKEIRIKYFISTEDGRIIRTINDNIIVKKVE